MMIFVARLLLLVHVIAPPAELTLSLDNLHGGWRLATDPRDVGETEGWAAPEFDDSGWRTIQAPGYWEPQGVTEPQPGRKPQPTDDRVRYTDYDGIAWYRRQVHVPAGWAKQPLVLRLGQVDDEDRTFINGRLVGATGPGIERAVTRTRRYDVPSEILRYGELNTVAVRVNDLGGPGGLIGPMISLLPADFGLELMRLPSEDRPVRERFANPPGSARVLRIHHDWPDDAEAVRMRVLSDLMRGFGGVATNVPFRGYLEDPAAWKRLDWAIDVLRDAGGAIWLYDEEGYPSGAAGGIVLRDHPEYEALGLLCVDGLTSGEPLELTAPPGVIRMALAVPVGQDGLQLKRAEHLDAEPGQTVRFVPPSGGAWHVMIIGQDVLYEGTHATSNVFRDRRAPNLLLAEATDEFLQVTHDRYAARYGRDLGRTFISTFTDEPSLMSYFMRPMPYRPLPWSPTLAADHATRWGEPLCPKLPLLYADGPGADLARYRFWRLITEQVSANYFGRIRQWCDQHGLRSGGHLLAEESLLAHVPFYGEFMACARELTAPGIDVLTSLPQDVPVHGGKLVASAGELCGNTVTMSEASDHVQRYRREGDARPIVQVTVDDIRGSLHRQQLSGINTFTSYYRFEPFATADLVALNTGIGRINTVLRGGHLVADIAVVYPVESIWPHYRPRVHGATDAPGAVAIDQAFTLTHRALFESGRDYCFVDTRGLLDAKVEGDRLTHGKLAWKVVVLPGVETLPQAAWETLDAFQKAGGTLIAVGPQPRNTDTTFPSPAVRALNAAWFGPEGRGLALLSGQEALLPSVLDNVLERDVAWSPAGSLKVTHRRVEDHDVWLVINDSPNPYRGSLTVCAEGPGEVWEPASGAIRSVPAAEVPVEMTRYGAVLLRYPTARERQRLAGGRPTLPAPQSLTFSTPTTGQGRYVDASLDELRRDGQAVWAAKGVLTAGEVDTFLFVRFPFPEPTDLSESRWLVIDTWTSHEQESGPPLLVLAGDRDGGTFLAEAGRSLGQAGHRRSYVPWTRFRPLGTQPAGSNGVLDISRITYLSLGWGGHYGQQGDRITFECLAPRIASPNDP